jgi:hypothetical protein
MRIDDVRVARCQQRMGAGAVYQVGAELLRTRKLGRRTVRMALRKIISGETGVGHAREDQQAPSPAEIRTAEAGVEQSGTRAPPATVGRGS